MSVKLVESTDIGIFVAVDFYAEVRKKSAVNWRVSIYEVSWETSMELGLRVT